MQKNNGRRFCRVLRQLEKTPGHADTNRFECIREAQIAQDERGFTKLEIPGNN